MPPEWWRRCRERGRRRVSRWRPRWRLSGRPARCRGGGAWRGSRRTCSGGRWPTRRSARRAGRRRGGSPLARLGKIPTTSVRRRISLFKRSCGLLERIWGQCSTGKALNAKMSSAASSTSLARSQNPAWVSRSTTSPSCDHVESRSGCSKIERTSVAIIGQLAFGTLVARLAMKWVRQRCHDASPSTAAIAALMPP